MTANLTQILNFKANFQQEFELFSKKKNYANNGGISFNQVKLEMVQRRAARFVKSRYRRTDSVTAMLDELGWPILSKERKDTGLILFYKIINNLAQVPHEHILTKA